MKDKYLDKYGNDSLKHIKAATQSGADVFVTNNTNLLKDRVELEKKFKIKIRTPIEMLREKGKYEKVY
jgi:predicted nucleic acid-binding protein